MLARIEEASISLSAPDRRLTRQEMKYVLNEFVRGANVLTINAVDSFFEQGTRVGGILSGGSVYTEMVKKVVERYAGFSVNSFVIAVDKENGDTAFEKSESDNSAKSVIICDDVINKGGTSLTALWAAGEYFPNATIRSGKGIDYAGGFEKRRVQKYMDYLCELFQDFADLSEDGKIDEAFVIFRQAEEYAQSNGVKLLPGWYIRKERLERI
jgi:hypothetical protein